MSLGTRLAHVWHTFPGTNECQGVAPLKGGSTPTGTRPSTSHGRSPSRPLTDSRSMLYPATQLGRGAPTTRPAPPTDPQRAQPPGAETGTQSAESWKPGLTAAGGKAPNRPGRPVATPVIERPGATETKQVRYNARLSARLRRRRPFPATRAEADALYKPGSRNARAMPERLYRMNMLGLLHPEGRPITQGEAHDAVLDALYPEG